MPFYFEVMYLKLNYPRSPPARRLRTKTAACGSTATTTGVRAAGRLAAHPHAPHTEGMLKLWMLVCALTLLAVPAVLAQTGQTDAQLALTMTTNLYCGTLSVLSGNIGLFIGFTVALYGLYVLIQTASMRGVYIIVCGALLTALPGLVITGLKGANVMLAGISTRATLPTPSCP
jgi:hypothetical protein